MDSTRWIKLDEKEYGTTGRPFLAYKCAYCGDAFGTCRSRHEAINHLDKALEHHEDHCPKAPGCGFDFCVTHSGVMFTGD